jgi:hypothetical protein
VITVQLATVSYFQLAMRLFASADGRAV